MTLRVMEGGADAVKAMGLADYIWLDGEGGIHVKKKAIYMVAEAGGLDVVPILDPWVATVYLGDGKHDRLFLNPCHYIPDPLRGEGNFIVLCEAKTIKDDAHPTNTRAMLRSYIEDRKDPHGTWWGFRQSYRFAAKPRGEHFIAGERHLCACMDAGLLLHSGQVDAPNGKWNFKLGPRSFPDVLDPGHATAAVMGDFLIFGRYLLEKIARENGFSLELLGCSVYCSTEQMRMPIEPEAAKTVADIVQARLRFPERADARHAWNPQMRPGQARQSQQGMRHSFIEDQGLDPAADPYITITRILDALGSEE
jgi:hypothetical protein